MKKITLTILLLLTVFSVHTAFAATPVKTTKTATTTSKTITKAKKPVTPVKLEGIFYFIPGTSAYASIQQYGDKMNIISPQTYTVNDTGALKGGLSDQMLALIADKKLKVMPLIANEGFNQARVHTLLASVPAQQLIIQNLITEAQTKNYIGWQFDFEHIPAIDRDAYSAFVEMAATEFHKNNLVFSVAVLARTSENPADLPEGSWDNWAGVFDYKRIGAAADFVSLMAYDMPASVGPIATTDWMKQTTAYVRKFIPAKKLSLGIPTYGWKWDVDTNTKIRSVGWAKIDDLQTKHLYKKKGFDTKTGEGWITFTEEGTHYKIWYENTQSFKQKYDFAKAQKLHGISIWAVGLEDPGIWKNFSKVNT